jgi:hypothetical protein
MPLSEESLRELVSSFRRQLAAASRKLRLNHGLFLRSGGESVAETICRLTIRFAGLREPKGDVWVGVLVERAAGFTYPNLQGGLFAFSTALVP